MRRLLIVGFVVLVVGALMLRQRLFLRDPFAKVDRNGMRQNDARVYLNYFNDVLVEDTASSQRYLVQAVKGVPAAPGTPMHLTCLQGMACLTERDYAPTVPLPTHDADSQVEMTSEYVSFIDGEGTVRVELR